jgi:hypothetical protein
MNGEGSGLRKYKVYWRGMLGGVGMGFGSVWGRILMYVLSPSSILHIYLFIPVFLPNPIVIRQIRSLLGLGLQSLFLLICTDHQAPPMELDDKGRQARDGCIHDIIERYKKREEWEIIDDVRTMVESIESRLGPVSTL